MSTRAPVNYRETFLRWHVANELGQPDRVLAVTALRKRILDHLEQVCEMKPEEYETRVQRRVNTKMFLYTPHSGPGVYPQSTCYLPVPVFDVESPQNRWNDLSAMLAATKSGGVLLTARSGGGKSLACTKVIHDCFREGSPLAGWLPFVLPDSMSVLRAFDPESRADWQRFSLWEALFRVSSRNQGRVASLGFCKQAVENWLNGPPLLIFADLNRVPRRYLGGLVESLEIFQARYPAHRCIVTYRSANREDGVRRDLVRLERFREYDMQPLGAGQAGRYLRTIRECERTILKRLGGGRSLPKYLGAVDRDCEQLEALIAQHTRADDSLISTPLLMHLVTLVGDEDE